VVLRPSQMYSLLDEQSPAWEAQESTLDISCRRILLFQEKALVLQLDVLPISWKSANVHQVFLQTRCLSSVDQFLWPPIVACTALLLLLRL